VELALQRDLYCRGLALIPGHRCSGPLVGHEPLKRSAGGDPTNADEVMIVCATLNGEIEDFPDLALAFGLTIPMSSRYENGRLIRRPYSSTDPQGADHATKDHPDR
jgi:hypothetical protein